MSENEKKLTYESVDGKIRIDVAYDGDMVWLTQGQMGSLFGKSKSTINERLKNVFDDGELIESKVMTKFGFSEFSRQRPTQHYNLDAVIALGSRFKSKYLAHFAEWADSIVQKSKPIKKFVLKHKDVDVVEIELNSSGGIEVVGKLINEKHLPVGVSIGSQSRESSLQNWWKDRSIPASREGVREMLEALEMYLPQQLLDRSLGLSLSDQYWICPVNTDTKWANVNFFYNEFSEDVGNLLFRKTQVGDSSAISLRSPDNTSDGVLKKKWKIIDGKRCLIKGGSRKNFPQEVANEVLAARICERLGIPFVDYWIIDIDDDKYSVCEDFINGDTELVPAWRVKQLLEKSNNISDYDNLIAKFEEFGIVNARLKVDMILTLDFIIANEDRHYNNFGLIRDANTLEWLSIAPVFDSGTAMWCKDEHEAIYADGSLESKPFRSRHDKQIKLVKDFSWLNLNALDGIEKVYENLLRQIVADESRYENRIEKLCLALRRRIEILREIVELSYVQ
ncbi:MAG: HipA domain-containing protein [Firmicutes bacterium]|nr:HipA domain-containing protein [Bacillota bacterium]